MTPPTAITPDLTLADITRLLPEAANVFEEAGIDYGCQGGRSLADAAGETGYQPDEIIERLKRVRRQARATNWFDKPLRDLIRHLTADHRGTVDAHVPAIEKQIAEAIDGAGETNDLRRIRILFGNLAASLRSHVIHEEGELFPTIAALATAAGARAVPRLRISQRVLRELVEHESFRDRLRTLCDLAERLPDTGVSGSLRAELGRLRNEVQRHMHLENNVLYPRAMEMENGLRRVPPV